MRTIEIAMAMLRQNDAYLLQRRPDSRRIGAAGLIGCFGGHREPKETYLQAVVRELGEETNLALPARRYTCIGSVNVPSDRDLNPVNIHAEVFSADVPAALQVEAKDGELVTMTLAQMRGAAHLLTQATRACLEELMGE